MINLSICTIRTNHRKSLLLDTFIKLGNFLRLVYTALERKAGVKLMHRIKIISRGNVEQNE